MMNQTQIYIMQICVIRYLGLNVFMELRVRIMHTKQQQNFLKQTGLSLLMLTMLYIMNFLI